MTGTPSASRAARRCDCHKQLAAAVARGEPFHDALARLRRDRPELSGYHEHRCECACGCAHDTLGYGFCPSCHFSSGCQARRALHHAATEANDTSTLRLFDRAAKGSERAQRAIEKLLASDWWALGGYVGP